MKKITIVIDGTDIAMDFEGFEARSCQTEEAKIRLLMARAGVRTDDEDRDEKGGAVRNGHAEVERVRN